MKKMIIVSLLLTATSAFAAKSNTEYYFQPAAGVSAVEANYYMSVRPSKTAVGAVETDDKYEQSDVQLSYMYGVNENNAFGIGTYFGSLKNTVGATSTTASGMGDIQAMYQGFTGMWRYGAAVGINTEKIKIDATTSKTSNRSSGGLSVAANVGLLMNSDALNYGADLSYLMPMEREVDGTSGTKITGGNVMKLSPFVEWNWGMGFLGAEFSYVMVSDYEAKNNLGKSTTLGESYMRLMANGSFDFNETFTGLLSLGMAMHPEHDQQSVGATKVKAYTETIASLGVRATF